MAGQWINEEDDAHPKLVALQDTKKALDEELAQIDVSLREAHAECGRHQNQRIPFISTLPDEIPCMIFEAAHQAWKSERSFGLWTGALALSHVSAHWHNIAVHLPALWTDIYVHDKSPISCVLTYLERSGRQPLSIHILPYNLSKDAFYTVWNRLIWEMFRWRSLGIAEDENLYETLGYLEHGSAPLLEEFDIEMEDFSKFVDIEHMPPRTIFLGGAPRLRQIKTHGLAPRNFWPPLSCVTRLVFTYPLPEAPSMSYAEFASLVGTLSALTHLSIEGDLVRTQYPPNAKLVFPSLRVLRLGIMYWGPGREMFPRFWIYTTAPRLEELYLSLCREMDVMELHDSHGLRPVFPALTSPIVEAGDPRDYGFSKETFEVLAGVFPNVIHLTLMEYYGEALKMLSVTNRWPDKMLLNLCQGENDCDVDVFKIQDMLKARIAKGRPIPKLRIANAPSMLPLLKDYAVVELMDRLVDWTELD